MEETLRVFRAACIPSHPFLKPEFIQKSEQSMRDRTLLQFETDVVDDGGIRAFLCRKNSFIEALFVDPAFQQRGLGKRLLDHLKARSTVVHLTVFAENPRAIKFYQREEFWAVKVSEHRETGETIVLLKWEAGKLPLPDPQARTQ
jgi:putative acetyltransferase